MKRTIIFLFMVLFTATGAQAQANLWTEFDVRTQATTTRDFSAIPAVIIGKDDRINITNKAAGPEKAAIIIEKDGRLWCSGALVGKNLVLTAAHCLYSDTAFQKKLKVYAVGLPPQLTPATARKETPKNKAEQTSALLAQRLMAKAAAKEYLSANVIKTVVPKAYISAIHKQSNNVREESLHDYGLLVLDTDLGDKTGWLKMAVPSDAQLKNAAVTLIGRGQDKPSKTLWKSSGQVGRVEAEFIYHNADFVAGNSGSPLLFSKDLSTVIGVNIVERNVAFLGEYKNVALRINQAVLNSLQHLKN